MLTLKLKDEILTTLGLNSDSTPEQAESAITKTLSDLKESTAMNDLTIEVVDKLSKRVEILENTPKVSELPKDFESTVKTIAETTAKLTAAQEVSAAIAKAGTVISSAGQPEEQPKPSTRDQFAAISDPTERGRFWNDHREDLLKSL